MTDRNKPIAELEPQLSTGKAFDRLIAAGRVGRPPRPGMPEPLQLGGDPHALSHAFNEIRGER